MHLDLGETQERRFCFRELLLIAVVMTAGVLLSYSPMIFSGFSRMQSDPGDTRFNNYVLEHSYRWVTGDPMHEELWSPPIFYPEKNTLAYSVTLLSLAPAYWVLRSLEIEPHRAFGMWMILMSVLTYLAAYCLLRHGLRRTAIGSSLGAWMMTFASSRIVQIGHQQLIGHFLTLIAFHALMVLFAHRPLSQRYRQFCWGLFWSCVVTQFYAGYYFGFFLFLCVALCVVCALCMRTLRDRLFQVLRLDLKCVLGTLMLAVVALSPLAWRYFMVASEVGMRGFSKAALPRLASYCYLGQTNVLYGWLTHRSHVFRDLPIRHEHAIGLGVATFLVTVWYLVRHRENMLVRLTIAVTLTIVIFCTVFPGEFTIHRLWFYSIPGMRAIRVMCRIGMLLAILAGIAIATLIDDQQRRRLKVASILLALFCCLEQVHKPSSYRIETDRERIDPIVKALRESNTTGPFFIVKLARVWHWLTPIDAMWISLEVGRPTVNGYSGNFPPEYDLFNPQPEEIAPALAKWKERYPEISITTLKLTDDDRTKDSTHNLVSQPTFTTVE
jgi:hypothetical protein